MSKTRQLNHSSGCEFTSFNAYEWTGAEERANNMQRNVIFRNEEDNEPQPTGGYIREVLRNGLREEEKLGVNPFGIAVPLHPDPL